MLLQHLICALILIGLAVFAIECALYPWMTEHQLRVWEANRYEGARARIEGSFDESRRYFSIALQEAKKLKNEKLIAASMSDLSSLQAAIKSSESRAASHGVMPLKRVWLSQLECVRRRSKDESFRQWEPYIRVLLQRQALLSQDDPQRLIELGDAFFEMVQYDLASRNFRNAIDACSSKQLALKVCAMDRLAEVLDFMGRYEESKKLSLEAISLSSSQRSSDSSIPTLKMHLAQTLITGGSPGQAEQTCRSLIESSLAAKGTEQGWYTHLLLGQSLAAPEKFDEGFSQLETAAAIAERDFGVASKEILRTYDAQFLYLLRAQRFNEAKNVFAKITSCRNKIEKKERPQSVMLCAFREGARYIDIDTRTAIWLLEWSLESKQKEQPNGIAVARRLYGLVKAYRKIGNRAKMLECWKRARAISPTDPGLITE